ncbi:C6 zinc finger domain-containing protein [Pleurostoma richardsiae]|uniref:C6 zinc finger domain-containing protein n=1 Tax=Pleurostoma richardsiae TaxID=41990 RepID=A0AA38RLN3_9PEZI|nr:C6 zinc finger domain-containing protein [Pleurostoma richardsiae]
MDREPLRRRRPALSCVECRRRKIKCDRNSPCSHCTSVKTQCVYKVYSDASIAVPRQHQRSRSPGSLPSSPAAKAPAPAVRITQDGASRPAAEGVRQSFGLWSRGAPPSVSSSVPNTTARNWIWSPNRPGSEEQTIQDLIQRVERLEESSASSPVQGLSETSRAILARETGLPDSQIIMNKTRLLGWSHWMGTAQEFAKVGDCYTEMAGGNCGDAAFQDPEIRSVVAQAGSLLQKCKVLARSIKVGRPSRSLAYPEFGIAPPSREVADSMVRLYFRSFESTHRILHVPSFWTEYHQYWGNRDSVTTGLRLKILLVIGIGSSLCERGDKDAEFNNMVHQWVYAAQTWLSGPLEKDRLNITGLQVHCLTILARQIFSVGGDLVWMSMGSLIHRAMQMGLHRDPKHLPAMSILQAELHRRLWATILEMVVQSSLDSAMPPRISFDEFDTEAPSNNNDEEISDSTTELVPHPKGTYTAVSIQLLLLDSMRTRLRVVQLMNSLHSELSYTDALTLSSDITDACSACSIFTQENKESGVISFHRNLLDHLVRRFLIPLHCPFAMKARTNPLFHYSRKISLDTAMALISPEPDEGFSHLTAIGGGFFREAIRYALAVISHELIVQVETQRLDGTLHRNSQHREILKQTLRDMVSLSVDRIRRGETNIKSHTFLKMIIAQVEAIEEGSSCELKMLQSARDSLEFCYGLLEAQASSVSVPGLGDMDIAASFDGGQAGLALDFDLSLFLPDADFS